MKIIVGSTNPVKVQAVKEVFTRVFKSIKIVSVQVESGVKAQPVGEKEIIKGAKQRGKTALMVGDGDYGVGLEGGVVRKAGGMMACAWCAIINRQGVFGLGGGMYFQLPAIVAKEIAAGEELGVIMDRITGGTDIKKKTGAIGILTKNLITRTEAYSDLVKFALVKFISPEYFDK